MTKNTIITLLTLTCLGLITSIILQNPKVIHVMHKVSQEMTTIRGIGIAITKDESSLKAWENAKEKMNLAGYKNCVLKASGISSTVYGKELYNTSLDFTVIKQ